MNPDKPFSVGILTLDRDYPLLPGNVAHPATHRHPAVIRRVIGLHLPPQPPLRDARGKLREEVTLFVDAALELEAQGVAAIVGSCGFFALMQEQAQAALRIPVATSPLLLLPTIQSLVGPGGSVGVLTLYPHLLTEKYFAKCGPVDMERIALPDMAHAHEFRRIIETTPSEADVPRWRREVVDAATALVAAHADVRALLLECSDMPPFTSDVKSAVPVPVFDYLSLIDLLVSALEGRRTARSAPRPLWQVENTRKHR